MNLRLLHGSKKTNLTHIIPFHMMGGNGCQDGVGINLTDSASLAINYATDPEDGSLGSVYIVKLNVTNFLTVNDTTTLTPAQQEIILNEIKQLPEKYQYRLATDFSGKKELEFTDKEKALQTYKHYKQEFKTLDLSLDRLKPEAEQLTENLWEVIVPTKEANLRDVTTSHLHYCLMLFDNHWGTAVLNKITEGLILERDSGITNYLSFAKEVAIFKELDCNFLDKHNATSLIQSSIDNSVTKELQLNDMNPS